jgi:hypothetical protein
VLPFVAAAVGIIVFLFGFTENLKKIWNGDSTPVLVVLISLLCVAYGVERVTYSTEIGQIHRELQQRPKTDLQSTKSEIWSAISRLMLTVEQNVRAVQSGDRPTNVPAEFSGLPDQFRARLADRKKIHGGAVKYRVVLVFDGPKSGQELEDIAKANAERKELYKQAGLADALEIKVFSRKPLTKFDVTIIDTHHAIIGFDTAEAQGFLKNNVEIQNAIIWENQDVIAQKLASWFDQTVWVNAEPYDAWLARQTRERSQR